MCSFLSVFQRYCLLVIIHCHWLSLTLFLLPHSWALENEVIFPLLLVLSLLHFSLLSAPQPVGGLCFNLFAERCIIGLWAHGKPSEVGLILYPFNRILIVVSLLGPMTYLFIGSWLEDSAGTKLQRRTIYWSVVYYLNSVPSLYDKMLAEEVNKSPLSWELGWSWLVEDRSTPTPSTYLGWWGIPCFSPVELEWDNWTT